MGLYKERGVSKKNYTENRTTGWIQVPSLVMGANGTSIANSLLVLAWSGERPPHVVPAPRARHTAFIAA